MKVKKILIPLLALLVLFAVAPAIAAPATKTPFTTHLTFITGNVSAGKMWITKGNILQLKNVISTGNATGDITGTVQLTMDETVDMNTGLGVNHGKFVFTVTGGTYEGSFRSMMTGMNFTGTFVAQGTGSVEGQKLMGSYQGTITLVDSMHLVHATFNGIILKP